MTDEPTVQTEERYCYLCLGITVAEVITYRAYVLSQCLSCHHVSSNTLAAD